MKIWMFNHYAITPEQAGGTRHFSLAQRLIERGHQPVIIASNYDHFNGKDRHPGATGPVKEDVQGVPFVWIPTRSYTGNGKGRALNMLDFTRGFRGLNGLNLEKPDVIFGSTPHLFTPYAAQKLARRMNVPFVLEIRDVWPQTLVDLGNFSENSPMIRVLAWMEKRLYRTADQIISLLPGAGDHCAALGAPRDRLHWIPNGIDLKFSPSDLPQRPEDGQFIAMFAGAHGLANGLDTVLDAAKITGSAPVKFRLMGDGPEKPRLLQRAKDEGISNVEFLDSVPKKEVYGQLAQADAYIMLLKASEVFRWGVSPNKLFDYMACGRPIVFAVSSSNSPVESAGCGLRIPADDPEALAEACRTLAESSRDERLAMGAKGRAYVEANHSFEVLTDRLEEALSKATQNKR